MRDKGNRRRRRAAGDNEDAAFRSMDAAHRRWGVAFVPPARQFREAIDTISPSPERLAQCENEVVRALINIDYGKYHDAIVIPNETYRRKCNKAIKALRTIEAFWQDTALTVGPFFGPVIVGYVNRSFLEDAKEYRRIIEQVVEGLPKRRGSKQPSLARRNAADCAYRLLNNFGKRPPVPVHEGHWQKLATILYGDENADLYKYLKTSTKPTTLFDYYTVSWPFLSKSRRC